MYACELGGSFAGGSPCLAILHSLKDTKDIIVNFHQKCMFAVFLCFFLCVLTFPWVLCKASSLIHVFYESKDERKVREIRCWRSRLGESVNWKDVICFCFKYGNTQSLVYLIAGYVTRLFDVSIYFALRTLFSRLVSPPFFAGCTPSH